MAKKSIGKFKVTSFTNKIWVLHKNLTYKSWKDYRVELFIKIQGDSIDTARPAKVILNMLK